MLIAVAGGTGVVGTHVVEAVESAGHTPVVLARSRGVDLSTGAGLDAALAGAGAVIDVSNVSTQSRKASVAFFGTATRNLLAAEQRAGVGHHVLLSIVGIDRVDSGYYAGKREQERLLAEGRVPWTSMRATQFHEFAGQVLDMVPGPLAIAPTMRTQPVAAAEVAEALVAIAAGPAQGLAPELAGPRAEDLADMMRRLVRARGERRRVLSLRLPTKGSGAMAAGALLPQSPGPRGALTFDDWLAAHRA